MRSLNARLVLSAGVWIAVVLIIGGFALSFVFQQSADGSFRRRLEVSVNALVAATDLSENGRITIARPLGDPRFEQALSGWYWQISTAGAPLARSRSLWDERLPLEVAGTEPGNFGSMTIQGPRSRTLWISYLTLQITGFDAPVRFMVAGDVSDLIQDRRKFDLVLMLSLVALGIGVLGALIIQVSFGLKPLRGLVQDLEAIRQRRAARLGEHYPEEIQPLIRVTNAVLEENQSQVERARRHVGNLAHALKTPLTLLRGETRAETDPARQTALNDQIEIISNLVEHHLARAAAAGASSFSANSVSVLDTATSICRSLEKIFAEEHRRSHIEIPPSLIFHGEREDLEEILGNVLENAFKWAKAQVHISAHAEAPGLRLRVYDDGPGMPEEEMRNVLDRGKRLDEMTPGHGLGLSIVVDLVTLYQGELMLERASTGGLLVSILFPPDRMV